MGLDRNKIVHIRIAIISVHFRSNFSILSHRLPYWTTTAEQQQYAAQQQFAAMHAQQYDATQHQQVATQQQQAAAKQQNVNTKHQEGAKQHQDEEKQLKEKTGTTKTIQERLE